MSGQAQAENRSFAARPWWRWLTRVLTLTFFLLVGYLLLNQVRSVEWDEVVGAMRSRPSSELWLALLLSAASFALYSCFDLLGRYATGHGLPVLKVMMVNFVSYAFNLNIGSIVGGVAFRYRLYSRFGLDADVITRVVVMSMFTNWIGYVLLSGAVFARPPFALPDEWRLGVAGLQALGIALLAVTASYVLLCTFARRRTWEFRGKELTLPSLPLALLQLCMSCVNWLLIAAILFVLLRQQIAFPVVLGTLLVAAIAGVLAHIPAGLGVLETVFVALLSDRHPKSDLLAALLTYRAVYYLLPLAMAALIYLIVELRAKKDGRRMTKQT
ncbi:MAG TPA: lysylphosphatidylglycerol synthase domain-containing protein [Noviherbaspirillum sp.]|nr:lysylphosphatidylglycerol synthase domain-containing protein [Noviherbaspirillum sp.]